MSGDREARYRNLLERAPVGQAIYDMAGRLVEVNAAWADLLGYEPAEVLGRRALDFVHPDDRPSLRSRVDGLINGDITVLSDERRLLCRDGSHRWVSSKITVLLDDDGRPVEFHSLVLDITDLKEVTEALRRSEGRYRAVVDALAEGIVIYSRDGLEVASSGALKMLGVSSDELERPDVLSQIVFTERDGTPIPDAERPAVRALSTGEPTEPTVVGALLPNGEQRWYRIGARPWYADDGDGVEPDGVVVTFIDITERTRAEEALRASEARFRTLAEELPVAVFLSDRRGKLVYTNPSWHELIGRADGPALADSAASVIHPAEVDGIQSAMRAAAAEQVPYHLQYRVRRADRPEDGYRWVTSRGAPLIDGDGRFGGVVGYIEDITPLVEAQEETGRLADIVESTSDLVSILDLRTMQFSYLNRAARERLAIDEGVEVDSLAFGDLHTDAATERFHTEVEPRLLSGRGWSGELDMRATSGEVLQVWQTLTPALGAEGEVRLVSSLGRDVSERRRMEAELAHRADHDPLTDLPNRSKLLERLEAALQRIPDDAYVAVVFLDLDRFKQVNDGFGHDVGDLLLSQVATRIGEVLRPGDIVARLGGDEFVVVCEGIADEDHAVTIATRVTEAIGHEPFVLGEATVSVTASVGIALSTGEAAHSEILLRDADAAMYRAKERGRARLELFDEAMRRRSAHRRQATEELSDALRRGELGVHYQPCVDLITGRVTAVEALARWHHPTRGLVGPGEFIPLAEETGLIAALGGAVLHRACADAREWSDRLGPAAPALHVNVSARQVVGSELARTVGNALAETGLAPSQLCLELTESILMDDPEHAVATLRDLSDLGVTLAIDDFGTGYSSLSYLRRFPVDMLKIDGSFVGALGPDPADTAFVGAIVNMAHSLGLEAVAEGVETTEQLDSLRLLGCSAAQGFLFSSPVPIERATELLTATFPV